MIRVSEVAAFEGAANGYQPAGDTVIDNDLWIGSEAVIMPGVKIGDGALIGTRALVTRDVEPYATVGGTPAKVIRKRFDDPLIGLLLEMRWWDWSDEQLHAAIPFLTSGEVETLHRHWLEGIRAA